MVEMSVPSGERPNPWKLLHSSDIRDPIHSSKEKEKAKGETGGIYDDFVLVVLHVTCWLIMLTRLKLFPHPIYLYYILLLRRFTGE